MQFPVIEHIDQVREAIKDRPEFIEAQREILTGKGLGKYTVFNYMVAHTDSFDCPIRRECRGLIFDEKGKVLSRRFHKFFNQGEKPETMNVDFSLDHVILDKLDGSMITPLVFEGDVIRWATKMGVTDIGNDVWNFLQGHKNGRMYNQFAVECYNLGHTPIFEYVAPTNRIVLPYKEADLVLLAMRTNEEGKYMPFDMLNYLGNKYNIPVVQPYKGSVAALANEVDIEGVVIRFDTGHMVKVKTDWYCAIHKAKENLLFEKNVLKLILEEKLDDIIPHLLEDDRKRIDKYQKEVIEAIEYNAFVAREALVRCANQNVSRKDFALKHANFVGKFISQIVFHCWDDPDDDVKIRQEVIKSFLRHTTSQTTVDAIRDQLSCKWEPMGEVE